MMSYLTRPGVPKKDNKMEDEKKIAEKQMIKVARQPDSRGVFQKAVKEQEKEYQKSLKPWVSEKELRETLNTFEDANIPDPKVVTFDPTTRIFTNADRTVAFKSYDDADKHNRSIGVKKEPSYPGATPQQFGKLAERLERNRQQQGKPTRVDEFEKGFNKVKKPIKKPTLIKIDIPTVTIPDPITTDPQQELRTQRFNRMVEDSQREKLREQSSGLAGLIGKKFI